MPTLDRARSLLLVVDLQARLVPAMAEADGLVANAHRLVAAAALLEVPIVWTEQNPSRLGATLPAVAGTGPVLSKMGFSATEADGFADARGDRSEIVIVGCEAHVCVMQSAIRLQDLGCEVHVVADAIGSRTPDNKAAALARLRQLGVDVMTAEMVVFEWLDTAAHPRFRDAVALVK